MLFITFLCFVQAYKELKNAFKNETVKIVCAHEVKLSKYLIYISFAYLYECLFITCEPVFQDK